MPLHQHHVDKLKDIYRKERGTEIGDAEAWAMATRLIALFRLLQSEPAAPHEEVRTK